MVNGFEINISEADFKTREIPEQNWILFQGVTSVTKSILQIDEKGCSFARKKNKNNWLKILSAISGGITFALGIIYIIYSITCR